MSRLREKTTATLLIAIFMISAFAVAMPMVSAQTTPTIDGVISSGEWGEVDFSGSDYDVYVLNDADYLYIAFEAEGGDFIAYPGMTNIYIYAGDDYAGECWAYTALGSDEIEGLTYFTTHHIQPPKVKEGKESRTTYAIVEASTLVMEWKIPLDEFPMNPGDPIAFDFMSYSEGLSTWPTAWLYEQYYTLWAPEYVYPCYPSFTGTLGDLSHGEWIHYANVYFCWPGNDLTDDSHSDWIIDRNFDGKIEGPGVPVERPSDGAIKTDERCVVYDWIGSDLEWSIRGRTLHFDEEYVTGVTRPDSTEPLVLHVTLTLESKEGSKWTFTGHYRTPFEVEGWPEEWKLYDYFEFKVVVNVDEMELVSYQYVEHEFYVP